MNVAFVWSDIKRPVGGAEYFLIDLIRFVKSSPIEIQISVYNIDEGSKLVKYLNKHDVIVLYSLNKILPLLPFIKRPAIIDVHSPDWLWYFRETKYGIKPSARTRLKRFWLFALGKSFYCRVLNRFDYETLGRFFRRAFLVPNFVDTSAFRPVSPKSDEFTVLVRYDPLFKGGFDVFLRSLRTLGRSRWLNVILVGRNVPEFVTKFMSKYVNSVETLGRLPKREQLAEVYSKAHATIIPSRYEGFPLTALESLASGSPIIMSDLPATSWFLEEITEAKQGTGLKFEPNNSVDLAFKIKKMYKLWLNNEGLYRKSVVKSRRVAELFSADRMVPEYLKLFFMIYHRDSND